MPGVFFAESALSDLEGILEWYADEGVSEIGHRLVGEILERVDALSEHPAMGRIVPEFGMPHLRELIHPPYRIVYRYDEVKTPNEVHIVRVWRSERLLRIEGNR